MTEREIVTSLRAKGRSFVLSLIFSQSPIVYVKMSFIDWLELIFLIMCPMT